MDNFLSVGSKIKLYPGQTKWMIKFILHILKCEEGKVKTEMTLCWMVKENALKTYKHNACDLLTGWFVEKVIIIV